MFNGKPGHEIVQVYDGVLKNSGLYEQAEVEGKEANDELIRAMWKGLDEFGDEKLILYPDGLLNLLKRVGQVISLITLFSQAWGHELTANKMPPHMAVSVVFDQKIPSLVDVLGI